MTMNLEGACERARTVRGPKGAARLYNDIEYELALGEPSDVLEDAGERALALLEGRFRGVREAAREIEQPPSLSRQASDALYRMGRIRRPRPPVHRTNRHVPGRMRAWSGLFAAARAHPITTVAGAAVSIVVIVHFWAYIALAAIALAALNATHARRK